MDGTERAEPSGFGRPSPMMQRAEARFEAGLAVGASAWLIYGSPLPYVSQNFGGWPTSEVGQLLAYFGSELGLGLAGLLAGTIWLELLRLPIMLARTLAPHSDPWPALVHDPGRYLPDVLPDGPHLERLDRQLDQDPDLGARLIAAIARDLSRAAPQLAENDPVTHWAWDKLRANSTLWWARAASALCLGLAVLVARPAPVIGYALGAVVIGLFCAWRASEAIKNARFEIVEAARSGRLPLPSLNAAVEAG